MSPEVVTAETLPAPAAPQAWLFHLDARNVLATHWEPLQSAGRTTGVQVRILETRGRSTRCRLSSYRPLAAAQRLDFCGRPLGECVIDHGKALLELGGHEWSQFEVSWEDGDGADGRVEEADSARGDG